MPKKSVVFLIVLVTVIVAGGCTKRQCVEADYPTFQPILDYPADSSTVVFNDPITFDWHHQEPCEPERYQLFVKDTVVDSNAWTLSPVGASELTEHLIGIFAPFKMHGIPGREYEWWVEATEWGEYHGPESQKFTFTYGEICSPSELVPPELVEPTDGSWPTATPSSKVNISWSNIGNCHPEEYHYQVALDPDFNTIVHTGSVENRWSWASIPVSDCNHYYWRVQSVVGNSASAFSEPFSFSYDIDGDCWFQQSEGESFFKVNQLSTCRQTDNKNSAAVMYLEEGAVVPIVATNSEKTWFLTKFDCFVSIATGEAEEGDLPLYPKQPLPVVDGQPDPGDPPAPGAEQKPCSSYVSGPRGCPSPRCVWVYPIAGPAYCRESD